MATKNQERVFKRVLDKVEKGGKIAISPEMKGIYGKAYQKNPQRLTKSKGWEALMEEHLPDKLLAEKHKALLNKQEVVTKNNMTTGEVDTIPTGEIDVQGVVKGLDMAYKLKGRYKDTEQGASKTLIINITGETASRYGVISNRKPENNSN